CLHHGRGVAGREQAFLSRARDTPGYDSPGLAAYPTSQNHAHHGRARLNSPSTGGSTCAGAIVQGWLVKMMPRSMFVSSIIWALSEPGCYLAADERRIKMR